LSGSISLSHSSMFYNISCYKTAAGPRNKLVERESCNTKCCKIWINGSKIYFQTKIHTIIAGGTKWGKRGVRNSSDVLIFNFKQNKCGYGDQYGDWITWNTWYTK
jgi:hypothetical protein